MFKSAIISFNWRVLNTVLYSLKPYIIMPQINPSVYLIKINFMNQSWSYLQAIALRNYGREDEICIIDCKLHSRDIDGDEPNRNPFPESKEVKPYTERLMYHFITQPLVYHYMPNCCHHVRNIYMIYIWVSFASLNCIESAEYLSRLTLIRDAQGPFIDSPHEGCLYCQFPQTRTQGLTRGIGETE